MKTKQAEIIENLKMLRVYQLMRLDPVSGNFIFKLPMSGSHKTLGQLWADLEEVQHEAMIEAIKGTQWTIIKIDWEI